MISMTSSPNSPTLDSSPRVALTTYSTKPRGGVVHTLELAEALQASGVRVTVIAMGEPGSLFRKVDVPVVMFPPPSWQGTLEERVFSWIDVMTTGLTSLRDEFDIVHSQDCISARAAARVRDEGARFRLVRTVHHVDDFTTQALIDCQRNAILEPDRVLVVSKTWQNRLRAEYGVESSIITNGVRCEQFAKRLSAQRRVELRQKIGAQNCFLYLTIGGIEPRKGSEFLVKALAKLKAERSDPPMLAIIGGHSFQDYRDYRERILSSLPELGLELGKDIVLLQTVSQLELVEWLAAADGFVFPSVNEGWGLVLMEAASAELPIVASDIEVFREFLVHDRNAILTKVSDPDSLARGMMRLIDEPETARTLVKSGLELATRHGWGVTADQHIRIYNEIMSSMRESVLPESSCPS